MRTRKFAWLLWIAIGALAVGLRIYSLDADPDWRLDWNPGLLTDEAFYMHNARNQVLFGQAYLDEFNNAVISPLVHWLHVVVFSWFGVGYVQGRWVSVVLGLLGVLLLGRVLWLAFQGAGDVNRAVPAAGLLALGGMFYLAYEHLYLLYNRTALLETPAAFFCLASLWCFAGSLCLSEAAWRVALGVVGRWSSRAGAGNEAHHDALCGGAAARRIPISQVRLV
jgi:hypothetical protein